MGTGIEWTDETWNPLTGCTKVSPGCDHCYAKRIHERFHGAGSFDTVALRPGKLDEPLNWVKPRRVFVNSMSDLFHRDVPDDYIADVFAVMAVTSQHTFQVLTKRHARMRALLSDPDFRAQVAFTVLTHSVVHGRSIDHLEQAQPDWWPLRNVWLGVSVENQKWADIRIPVLIDTPAEVRFISAEPLLGGVDLCTCYPCGVSPANYEGPQEHCLIHGRRTLDWVIAGGESGPGARPMNVEWARALRDQCTAAGVPFHFKQHGEFYDGERLGKKESGRILDGRTWDQYPQPVPA